MHVYFFDNLRLNGSYEALKGGSSIEAMEDFTGGVGETFEVKKAPKNFYELLQRALKRGSMVGCSIDVSRNINLSLSFLTGYFLRLLGPKAT